MPHFGQTMIIDFHTHIFPDKIAHKTIDALSLRAKIPFFSRGDTETTLKSMDEAGIDKSVVLSKNPVTTDATFSSIISSDKEIA